MKRLISLLAVSVLGACAGTANLSPGAKIVGDYTEGVSRVCLLHKTTMQRKAVVVIYGHLYSGPNATAARDRYEHAKRTLFPFGEEVFATSDENPAGISGLDHVWVYVCRECVVAAHDYRYGKKG